MVSERGLPFLTLPPRSRKPRSSGLTVVKDRALGEAAARAIVETCGDIVDWIKFTDHAGLIERLPVGWLRERIALYQAAGIPVRPGGIPFEIAVVQGQADAYFERLRELGFDGVEISEDSITPLPAERRRALIIMARELGLTVFTELGRKISDGPLDVSATIAAVRADREAGVSQVTIENTDLLVWWEEGPTKVDQLIEAVGLEAVVFEARPGGWPTLASQLLRRYGPEVNFENLMPEDASLIESMRIGMTRDVDYWFLTRENGSIPSA